MRSAVWHVSLLLRDGGVLRGDIASSEFEDRTKINLQTLGDRVGLSPGTGKNSWKTLQKRFEKSNSESSIQLLQQLLFPLRSRSSLQS